MLAAVAMRRPVVRRRGDGVVAEGRLAKTRRAQVVGSMFLADVVALANENPSLESRPTVATFIRRQSSMAERPSFLRTPTLLSLLPISTSHRLSRITIR